jgi:uncharacterized protein
MDVKIRRDDRAISLKEAKEILKGGDYGVLSLASMDGQPYGVPLNYCCLEDAIFIHCAVEGRKLDIIKENNKVSFCVVGKTELLPDNFSSKYESAIVCGKIVEVVDDEKQFALVELLKKYYQNNDNKGLQYIDKFRETTKVYKIEIEAITGKAKK